MKQKKHKPARKSGRSKKKSQSEPSEYPVSWVDQQGWMPTQASKDGQASEDGQTSKDGHASSIGFSVISWNVLADAYCNHRSHRHLPIKFQRHVFDRPQRQHHIRQTLRRMTSTLMPSVFALQEVDPPLEVSACMKELGYDGVETTTSTAGKDGRVDACALYYRADQWMCVNHRVVRLDDLATMCSKTAGSTISAFTTSNLQGVQTSFVRKNMALLVRLRHKQNNQEVVVAVLHLYWNPAYEYVKLCQVHYVLQLAKDFCGGSPFVLAGDFNSQPKSSVHRYLVNGFTNGKLVAPWYDPQSASSESSADDESIPSEAKVSDGEGDRLGLASDVQSLSISDCLELDSRPSVRYLLDFTLNRLCRWLRILGVDAALETEEEELLRTKEGKLTIFERCKKEKRTLVTTSTKLMLRKDCPPGAYVLNTTSLSNLEVSLVHLLLSHGVVLEPRKFLTRCVVCNGSIEQVRDEEQIRSIFSSHQIPDTLNEEILEVFQCSGCSQGYWWCDRPTSSASRVKTQATKLLRICIRGGVPVADDMAMFDFVDVDAVRAECPEGAEESLLRDQRLDVIEWLQEERLENPFGSLKSAYASEDGEETLRFTNVTADFVGHLDYIMFKDKDFKAKDLLYAPTTYKELDIEKIRHGHLLPSDVWPSDHLAVGTRLSFAIDDLASLPVESTDSLTKKVFTGDQISGKAPAELFCMPATAEASRSLPSSASTLPIHGQRCGCGCVPNILSLFEMAELRKQARLKKEAQTSS